MSVELNALVEATKISKTEEIAGNTFYEAVLNGVDVVLVKTGIGKVLAASCAETLIDTYHVGGIVFTGIAGGVGDDVNVLDMVIATELVQHDYGTETNSGFEWNGKAGSNQETGMIPVENSKPPSYLGTIWKCRWGFVSPKEPKFSFVQPHSSLMAPLALARSSAKSARS